MVHLADYVNFSSKSVCGLWIFFFLPNAGNPFQKRDSFQTPGFKALCSCAYARTEAGWKGKIKLSEAGAACLGIIYLVRGGEEGVQGRVGVTRHRSLLPPLPAQCAHGPPYRKLSAEQRRNPNYVDSYMLVRSKYLQALRSQKPLKGY